VAVPAQALVDIRKHGGDQTVWYLPDHWKGFQFVAPRVGMKPVHPGRSLLRAGDWVLRDSDHKIHEHGMNPSKLEVVEVYWDTSAFPLRVLPDYFEGKYPIQRREPPRIVGVLYRVRADFIPQDPWVLERR
jgi:hypothetical protein